MDIVITTRDFSNDDSQTTPADGVPNTLSSSISRAYRSILRAEAKKKYLIQQLPQHTLCARRNGNLYLFCTDKDHRRLTQAITQLKRSDLSLETADIQAAVGNVRCRLRRVDSPDQNHIQNTLNAICTFFNQLVFVAQMRHYCEKNERALWYSREELSKRCGEKSDLGAYIQRFVTTVDNERHRELCTVLIGLLHQTPHMWARSIRLLSKLKNYLESCFMVLLQDSGISVDSAFESPYQNEAHKLLFYMGKTDVCQPALPENKDAPECFDPPVIAT
ncbi:protein UL34 [Aotine betaherpesvirus 1]|uniref:Protein UL34 n=1 Tax=Aotine betaherpesvirus 1 TaxID=50290 RepID=G8XUA9_9BETA|nr:protein UL34 [Aotine betaherpesvirus 1]AEV80740.1 protein UL34 [Aotine betaherpesvirus 1]